MVFRPRQRRQTLDVSIRIDNNMIDCVKEKVFLGVILEGYLSWIPRILSVYRKISNSIGIIFKSGFCLPKTSLHCLYYSVVYPYLIYCISMCGSTFQSNLSRVIILQKKFLSILTLMFFLKSRIFWNSLTFIYIVQIGKFTYLFKRGLLPNYFRDMFTLASQLHSHSRFLYKLPCHYHLRHL